MISIDSQLPRFLERAREVTLTLPVYEDDLVAPSSGTYTLLDNTGEEIVSARAVTISNSIAQVTLLTTDIPVTTALNDDWQEKWVLVIDGVTHTIWKDVYVCRKTLYPIVTPASLERRVFDIQSVAGDASLEDYISEAWEDLQFRLIAQGRYPYLIMNPGVLKEVHTYMTLHLVYSDAETHMGEGRYSTQAKEYESKAERAFDTLKLEYDHSESGKRSESTDGTAAVGVIYTNMPNYFYTGGLV